MMADTICRHRTPRPKHSDTEGTGREDKGMQAVPPDLREKRDRALSATTPATSPT